MPVRKFRSVEEMSQPVWRTPGDEDLYRAIAGVWAMGMRLSPRTFRPGVRRYRSIEALKAAVAAGSIAFKPARS
jgi:hypothetical protein